MSKNYHAPNTAWYLSLAESGSRSSLKVHNPQSSQSVSTLHSGNGKLSGRFKILSIIVPILWYPILTFQPLSLTVSHTQT